MKTEVQQLRGSAFSRLLLIQKYVELLSDGRRVLISVLRQKANSA